MELFAVIDKALFGRGVFGIFSTYSRAHEYMEQTEEVRSLCEIKPFEIQGEAITSTCIYSAYTYIKLYDLYVLEGLYTESFDAYTAAGHNGMVIEWIVDKPEHKRVVSEF